MLMSNQNSYGLRKRVSNQRHIELVLCLCTALLATALVFVAFVPMAYSQNQNACSSSSKLARLACKAEIEDDYWIALANCENITDSLEKAECQDDAAADKAEGRELCGDQLEARLEVCELIGHGPYDPDFDPVNFVDPNHIGDTVNPSALFPLVVGNKWVYEGGGERVTVVVTDKTKLIEGVTCRVVNDVVTELDEFGEEGPVIEDTDDWYAQDLDGNVHYCGELARDFEINEGDDPEEAELVEIEGSFKAGRDGAKSGFLVLHDPQVGDGYRQEFDLGNAEDVVEVISVTGTESTPAASCTNSCVVTRDFTPIEPDAEENKYYAPGVGPFLEIDPESGERLELVFFGNIAP